MKHQLTAVILALSFAAALPVHAQESSSPLETIEKDPPRASLADERGWWSPWHIVDYALVGMGAGAYLVATNLEPQERALFGPRYEPDDPAALFTAENADAIGRTHRSTEALRETVPAKHLILMAAGVGGAIILQEGLLWAFSDLHGSARMFHEIVLGYLETQALTGGLTEVTKVVVGRLRPDFMDRAGRYECNSVEDPAVTEAECTALGYADRPLADDFESAQHILDDGRKSFWSGHSAFAFSTAAYATLVIGGRWVWGDRASRLSRSLGMLGQMGFMTSALFIAGSRVDDSRHHFTDVLVGSAIGTGLAAFSYYRRFDGDGRPIRNGVADDRPEVDVDVTVGPGSGLTLTVRH